MLLCLFIIFSIALAENSELLQANFFIDDFYSKKEHDILFTSYKNNLLKLVLNTLSKIKKKLSMMKMMPLNKSQLLS